MVELYLERKRGGVGVREMTEQRGEREKREQREREDRMGGGVL